MNFSNFLEGRKTKLNLEIKIKIWSLVCHTLIEFRSVMFSILIYFDVNINKNYEIENHLISIVHLDYWSMGFKGLHKERFIFFLNFLNFSSRNKKKVKFHNKKNKWTYFIWKPLNWIINYDYYTNFWSINPFFVSKIMKCSWNFNSLNLHQKLWKSNENFFHTIIFDNTPYLWYNIDWFLKINLIMNEINRKL